MIKPLESLEAKAKVKPPSIRRAAPLDAARPFGAELAKHGEFILVERPMAAANGWRSLKLIRTGRAKKRNWWLGWNGDRLSRNADTQHLSENHSEIKMWIERTLRGDSV